jgi:hypothetical protein
MEAAHPDLEQLPVYCVRARNTSADSENGIHDDAVAAQYGFRGGLVPGITIYAYMTVPLVERFSTRWLERGTMQVKFHEPVYDGEEVLVRSEIAGDETAIRVAVRVEREGGTVCATGLATLDDQTAWLGEPLMDSYPKCQLPDDESRPIASSESIVAGAPLGTLEERLDLEEAERTLLPQLEEKLGVYRGAGAVAHPFLLLAKSNYILMRNFRLGPWIHVGSDLINRGTARHGDVVSVRGRIRDRYDKKGHEFVVLDLLVVANDDCVIQQVRHTAIYRPRIVGAGA